MNEIVQCCKERWDAKKCQFSLFFEKEYCCVTEFECENNLCTRFIRNKEGKITHQCEVGLWQKTDFKDNIRK
jgi:hypothetical protein